MNSITAHTSPKPAMAKHFVLFLLLTMLCMTAIKGGANSVLNTSGLLVLVWPISMFIFAWLNTEAERDESDHAGFGNLVAL